MIELGFYVDGWVSFAIRGFTASAARNAGTLLTRSRRASAKAGRAGL